MPKEEFLDRLKLTSKVETVRKFKAEKIHVEKSSDKDVIQKTIGKVKTGFSSDAPNYMSILLGGMLQKIELTSDLVKKLAAFDSFNFRRPLEIALLHFDFLYSTFQLHSWMTSTYEAARSDQYLKLLDFPKTTFSAEFEITNVSQDLTEFFKDLEFLQT